MYARKKKNGQVVYYIVYPEVPSGRQVRRAAGTDKQACQLLEVERICQWERFKVGLYHPAVDQGQPIKQHLLAYLVAVEQGLVGRSKGKPTDKHVEILGGRLKVALHAMKAQTLADLTPEGLSYFLQELEAGRVKDQKGRLVKGRSAGRHTVSAATRDGYGVALKQFGRWLEDEERVLRNPFRKFRSIMVAGRDEVYVRRAMDLGEVVKLAEAVPERACLYYVAVTTGLRKNELKSLRWQDVRIHGEEIPHIALPGFRGTTRVTKNGKAAKIPLQPWVASMLLEHRTKDMSKATVFQLPYETAKMIRADAEFAGVAVSDDQGRILDFHSLRSSAATILLSMGVHPDMVQEVMRHADIRTTMTHYRKSDFAKLAAAVVVVADPRRVSL